jgi:hypothetical protein
MEPRRQETKPLHEKVEPKCGNACVYNTSSNVKDGANITKNGASLSKNGAKALRIETKASRNGAEL